MISASFIDFVEPFLAKRNQALRGIIECSDWRNGKTHQKKIDVLEAQAVMQRLGFMSGLCEFWVSNSEFDYLCLREAIWKSFYHAEWESWEKQMEQCAAFSPKNPLYQQFYEEMICRKMLYDEDDPEAIETKVKAALALTKKEYLKNRAEDFLSSGEMRLLELYALVLEKKGNRKEAKDVLESLTAFLELKSKDDYMKLELLPDLYAVYGAFLERCGMLEETRQVARRGLELLDVYHQDWNRNWLNELCQSTEGHGGISQALVKKHALGIGEWDDTCSEANLLKNISPYSEILFLCRRAVGMTQKEVVGEYYDAAQISRIENGKRLPGKTMRQFFAKRIGSDRGAMVFALQKSGIYQIEAQMRILSDLYKNNYESAKWRLQCLEKSLDLSVERNRQFIFFTAAFADAQIRKINQIPQDDAVYETVKAQLRHLIPKQADYKYWPFQIWEFLGVAACLEAEKDNEKKKKIREDIMKNYQNRRAWASRFAWEMSILQKES